jgi:ankyrin repeat protein
MNEQIREIFKAADKGNIAEVEKSLLQNVSINVKNYYNESLLIIATRNKNLEFVEYLLNRKDIDIHTQGYLTGTALTLAIFSDQNEITKELLNKENTFNSTKYPGAINFAVLNENRAILKLLSDKGANFDIDGFAGHEPGPEWVWKPAPDPRDTPFHEEYHAFLQHTPLNLAITYKKPEIVEFLLKDCHVNPNFSGENGIPPLQIAAEKNDKEMVKLLLRYGADPKLLDHSKLAKNKIDPSILKLFVSNVDKEPSRKQLILSPSVFWDVTSPSHSAEVQSKDFEKNLKEQLIAFLKSNATLWENLKNSPQCWETVQKEVKNEILKSPSTELANKS